MAGDFDDILADNPPNVGTPSGSLDDLFDETQVVPAQRSTFNDILLAPIQASSKQVLKTINEVKEYAVNSPALKPIFTAVDKIVSPLEFAAKKAAIPVSKAGEFGAKIAETFVDGFFTVTDKLQRNTQGRMFSDVVRGGVFPSTGEGNPALADRMGDTPSAWEIIKAMSPSIEAAFPSNIPGAEAIHPALSPDLSTNIGKANLGFTAPLRAGFPGVAPAAATVLDAAQNIPGAGAMPAKFALGAGLMATDPSNLVFGGLAKGASALIKSKPAIAALSKFAETLLDYTPAYLERKFQIGQFALPAEFQKLLDNRAARISSTLMRGQKVLDETLELTPSERMRLAQIRKGSVSVAKPGERFNVYGVEEDAPALASKAELIRQREQAFGGFIDVLSERLLKENENAIKAGKPLFSDETAEIIKANVGQYMPRDYMAFHGKLQDGRIPTTFLQDIYGLSDGQLDALSKLSPKAAEDMMELQVRGSMNPYPDASGFKPMRVRQQRFKPKTEAREAQRIFAEVSEKQGKLRKSLKGFNLDSLGMDDVDVALMNRAKLDLEDIAAVSKLGKTPVGVDEYDKLADLYRQEQSVQAKLTQALGRPVTIERTRKIIEKAGNAVKKRNQIMGQIGDLEFQKSPSMLQFMSNAKFGLDDISQAYMPLEKILVGSEKFVAMKSKIDADLSGKLGRLLDRKVMNSEIEGIVDKVQKYKMGAIKQEQLGELQNAVYDFETYKLALGEIKDPTVLGAKAIRDLTLAGENARLFNLVAINPEWTLPAQATGKAGYELLPESRMLGSLSGRYVKSQIADDINTMMDFQRDFDKFFTKGMALWKFGKTITNPATHFRNMMTNSIFLDFGGTGFKRQMELYPEAFEQILERGGMYKRAMKAGAIHGTFIDSDLKHLQESLIEVQKEGGKIPQWWMRVPAKMADKAATIYSTEEEAARLVKFMDNLSKGMSDAEAAADAQHWLINFSHVPPAIRWARSSPIGMPFISFPYKALPLVGQTLRDRPLTVLKYEYMFRAIEAGSAAAQGIRPDVAEAQKKIAKKDSPLFTRFLRLPHTDQQGWPFFMDLTYVLPWGDLGDVGSLAGIPPAAVPGGLLKPLFEIATNRSLFTGKEVWGNEDRFRGMQDWNKVASVEEGALIAQKMASHFIKSYAPNLMPGVPGTSVEGGWGYERLKRSLFKQTPSATETEPQPVGSAVLDTIFGIKTRSQNIEETLIHRIDSIERDMDSVMGERVKIARDIELGRIDPKVGMAEMAIKERVFELLGEELRKLGELPTD